MIRRLLALLLAFSAGAGSCAAVGFARAGTDQGSPTFIVRALKNDGPISIARRLAPDCAPTSPEFKAFWPKISAANRYAPFIEGQGVIVFAEDVPTCPITAPATTSAPSTAAPTSTTVTAPLTTAPTTSISASSSGSLVPTLSQVGPRGSLASRSGLALPCGSYDHVKFTTVVELDKCAYTFTDADIPGIISRYLGYVGPGPKVTMSHAIVRSGIYFEDGGQAGWSISWSLLDGGPTQALRPKGPGTITLADSLLLTYGTPLNNPDLHAESFQAMSGADVGATRVGFSVEPRWSGSYTPITAVFTFEAATGGGGSTLTDCEFGYLTSNGWAQGGGYFAVYPGKATFVRPRVHAAAGSAWYAPPVALTAPVYL